MDTHPTRLFHLHYQVPNVAHAEAVLEASGLAPHRRYGHVGGESRSLRADDPAPEGFRLRLQDVQRGIANVTIAPGPRLEFDHLGVLTADFDGTLARARERGWYVNEGDHRTFLHAPWEFRVEIQPDNGAVASSLGPESAGRFASVVLTAPDPESVRTGLDAVLGDVPSLSIGRGHADRPSVTRLSLAGDAVPDDRPIRTRDLDPAEA